LVRPALSPWFSRRDASPTTTTRSLTVTKTDHDVTERDRDWKSKHRPNN